VVLVVLSAQDESQKSRSKSPRGAVASFVQFVRQVVGQPDGFVTCIALLVAAVAISYTGVCKGRRQQKTAPVTAAPVEPVPAVKKKVT